MDINELHTKWSLPMRYALAVAVFLAALILRLLILSVESGLGYLMFYPAVVVSFYVCGNKPGWLMAVLSAIAGYYIFTLPHWIFEFKLNGVISVTAFLTSAYLLSYIVEQMKNSEQRYQCLLEDQMELICRYKVDGTVTYVNMQISRLFRKFYCGALLYK